MYTFISFLRGVNMTGHNSIRMTDLAALYAGLGYLEPETYIQSGNVVYNTTGNRNRDEMAAEIEGAIHGRYGYTVPAMVRTVSDLKAILGSNPYLGEESFNPSKMAVIFLHGRPSEEQVRKVSGVSYPPDKFAISGSEIYTYCPNGFGRTKLYTNFFEKKMKVTGTARNWKTIVTLLDMAEKRKYDLI
jgi:uncharacterized protein (DUF1697 family)